MHMGHLLVITGIGVIRGGPGSGPQHWHGLRGQFLAHHGGKTRGHARDQPLQGRSCDSDTGAQERDIRPVIMIQRARGTKDLDAIELHALLRLIAQSNAPDLNAHNFTAMTRLDHNRAMAQLATKTGSHVNDIRCMTIWGNHSATQYPDINHASVGGKKAGDLTEQKWLTDEFIPVVQQRGAAIIQARGASSAASAASAAIDHMHDWALGTPADDWVSMAVSADGSYGIEPGIIYSYPVRCSGGDYEIVQGLSIDDFSRERMDKTEAELREERAAIEELL